MKDEDKLLKLWYDTRIKTVSEHLPSFEDVPKWAVENYRKSFAFSWWKLGIAFSRFIDTFKGEIKKCFCLIN